ncbi:uncharacterized protein LOC125857124 [Solanum stenotomum]|uniref:uncharacterized protein LOC125857124 n=1 Tax=Solanum stenotomum TaxID=172797 RepID=UPI0020D038F1|nr:uncharacterized protein LOC125857124 [Solanum stenotomum]
MRIAIIGHNKLGFIDGSCKKDSYGPNLENLWERCNAIVLSWIMNCVSKELLGGVIYSTNAAAVWKDLAERYDKIDGFRIFQLYKEIATVYQGTSSILAYLSKLRELWVEYDSIALVPRCDCVNSRDSVPATKPKSYTSSSYDPNVFYDYCKRTGHTQGMCYKLHGYPPGYERKKKSSNNSYERGRNPNERRPYPNAHNVIGDADLDYDSSMNQRSHDYGRGSRQTDHTDYHRVCFFPDFAIIQDLYSETVKVIGRENAGVYLLPPHNFHSNKTTKCYSSSAHGADHATEAKILLWHQRLGHTSSSVLSHALDLPTDVWGPFNTPTYDGNRFYVTIVDDCTLMLWLFLIKVKSDVCVVLKNFFTLVRTQFNAVIKTIRTDNGSEFVNSECQRLYTSLGIVHQRTCIHTPQQNRIAERKHKHLLEVARAVRFQGHIPLKFWEHCILSIAYIINRLPTPVLHDRSPYEVFHNIKPSLHHMRVLGCFANNMYIHDKFQPKSVTAIHMATTSFDESHPDIVEPVVPSAPPVDVPKVVLVVSDAFLSSFGSEVEPGTFEEACKDPRWVEAMQAEISTLETHHT